MHRNPIFLVVLCSVFASVGTNAAWISHNRDPLSDTNKRAYERVHKGEIKCIDNPDGTVYCYKAKEEK